MAKSLFQFLSSSITWAYPQPRQKSMQKYRKLRGICLGKPPFYFLISMMLRLLFYQPSQVERACLKQKGKSPVLLLGTDKHSMQRWLFLWQQVSKNTTCWSALSYIWIRHFLQLLISYRTWLSKARELGMCSTGQRKKWSQFWNCFLLASARQTWVEVLRIKSCQFSGHRGQLSMTLLEGRYLGWGCFLVVCYSQVRVSVRMGMLESYEGGGGSIGGRDAPGVSLINSSKYSFSRLCIFSIDDWSSELPSKTRLRMCLWISLSCCRVRERGVSG